MAPNVACLPKMVPTFVETQMNTFFGGNTETSSSWSLWEKICRQKSHNNFSGKFGEIRAKIHCTPKYLLPPIPMLHITVDVGCPLKAGYLHITDAVWGLLKVECLPGPSPGFSSKGVKDQKEGPKTRRGGHIFKIQYWMYAATGWPNVKWREPISNGGAGHHWPPFAGDDPGAYTL